MVWVTTKTHHYCQLLIGCNKRNVDAEILPENMVRFGLVWIVQVTAIQLQSAHQDNLTEAMGTQSRRPYLLSSINPVWKWKKKRQSQ